MPNNAGPEETRSLARTLGLTGVVVLVGLASSCLGGLGESIEQAVDKLAKEVANTRTSVETESKDWQTTTGNAIDDAISQLGSSTSDVTGVLNDLVTKLPAEVNATIRGELTNLVNRTVAAAGVEAKCSMDFIRVRAVEGLRWIKDKLLGVESPPPPPHICQVVPLVVDMSLPLTSRNRIELYGFNMDQAPVTATVESTGGGSTNITSRIDRPSHYHLTLNLSGTPSPLTSTSQRIKLVAQGDVPHTIAVLQPAAKVCATKSVKTLQQSISFIPPYKAGGRNFHYKNDSDALFFGPRIRTSANLSWDDSAIRFKVWMRAATEDPTQRKTLQTVTQNAIFPESIRNDLKAILNAVAEGDKTTEIYKAPIGWKIHKVNADTFAGAFDYNDVNFALDSFDQGAVSAVRRYEFEGSVNNQNDAGGATKANVTLNPIEVELIEAVDCVPPGSLKLSRTFLSATTITSLNVDAIQIVTPRLLMPLGTSTK